MGELRRELGAAQAARDLAGDHVNAMLADLRETITASGRDAVPLTGAADRLAGTEIILKRGTMRCGCRRRPKWTRCACRTGSCVSASIICWSPMSSTGARSPRVDRARHAVADTCGRPRGLSGADNGLYPY
jgi:hypothetical protein